MQVGAPGRGKAASLASRQTFSWASAAFFLASWLVPLGLGSTRAVRGDDPREATALAPGLVAAIRDGNAAAVGQRIEEGAAVNARDEEGNTPLILAAFSADPVCVALLLAKGAEVNAANKAGVTALIRAATNSEKTRLLVDAGARVQVRTADGGNTPLILDARRADNSRTVRLLLERGADATERNDAGIGPIVAGAASGDLETVRSLLAAGAHADDFPQADNPVAALAAGLRTPLMWAAYANDEPMVRLLLDHGADPNRTTYYGSPLSHACWNDGFEAAAVLIDRGAQVNARDAVAGFTPLHWAAGNETLRPHLVRLLVGSGADPNAAGGESVGAFGLAPQTPRSIAERQGQTAIVAALEAAGARQQLRPAKVITPHRTIPEDFATSTLIASAEVALAALQATATRSREAFLRHASRQDCVSCHQQYLPMAAIGHARDRFIRFDRDAARDQVALMGHLRGRTGNRESVAQALFHPDPAHTFGYELLGLAAESVAPTAATDAQVHHLVTVQAADGRWINNIPRPPMMSNDASATALSIRAIQHYGWRGRGEEFASSIERARAALRRIAVGSNEEAVFQLLGLHWAGEPDQKLAYLARSLRMRQRDDGGWAQLPTLDSDAYATGQALYALAQVGTDLRFDPAARHGLRFLLERQEDDGTWHVGRRAFPFQPTMPSGFPHHRDAWISAAATSWAVLALTQATPLGSAAGQPPATRLTPPARAASRPRVDFASQVKPLLERSCVGCHGEGRPRGLFRVDGRQALLNGGASGEAAVIPGHGATSPLLDYVSGNVPDFEMPPRAHRDTFPALRPEEVATLHAWIDQGAEWPDGVSLSRPKGERPR